MTQSAYTLTHLLVLKIERTGFWYLTQRWRMGHRTVGSLRFFFFFFFWKKKKNHKIDDSLILVFFQRTGSNGSLEKIIQKTLNPMLQITKCNVLLCGLTTLHGGRNFPREREREKKKMWANNVGLTNLHICNKWSQLGQALAAATPNTHQQ